MSLVAPKIFVSSNPTVGRTFFSLFLSSRMQYNILQGRCNVFEIGEDRYFQNGPSDPKELPNTFLSPNQTTNSDITILKFHEFLSQSDDF